MGMSAFLPLSWVVFDSPSRDLLPSPNLIESAPMSLPEITAMCRVLARSNAEDQREQARNLDRLQELSGYLSPQADPGMTACLEAATTLIGALAQGERPGNGEILATVCKLLATVEKNWNGQDPDAITAAAIYGTGPRGVVKDDGGDSDSDSDSDSEPRPNGPRLIRSSVAGARTMAFEADELGEAQRRIEQLKQTPRINEMVLGELLVELGHATAPQIQESLEEQEASGMLLGQILVEQEIMSPEAIEETVRLQHQLRGGSTRASLDKIRDEEEGKASEEPSELKINFQYAPPKARPP